MDKISEIREVPIDLNNENEKKDYRNTGLDFLRIVCMLLVVTSHTLGESNLTKYENINSNLNYCIITFIYGMVFVSLNCYILISGYFLVKSTFKIKKFFKLWGEVIFYSIIIYIVLVVTRLTQFNVKDFIFCIFPVFTKGYWFVNVYLGMYLLFPFLNKLAYSLNKDEYKKLLLILMILFSALVILPAEWCLDATGGNGIIWFCCLYLVAAYIRLYISEETTEKHHNIYFFIFIGMAILIFILRLMIEFICKKLGINNLTAKMNQISNPLIAIESIVLFLYFRSLKIKNKNVKNIILSIAPLTFAVYLIHDNRKLKKVLYSNILHIDNYYGNPYIVFIAIGFIVLIFTVCIIIEFIRKSIAKNFKKINLNKKST